MLTPGFLYHVADKAVALWEKFNVWAIRDICRRIADAGGHMTATAEWQIYKMEQAGMARDDIKRGMKKLLKASDEEVARIFEEAAVVSHGNDADIFAKAGVRSVPFSPSAARKAMQSYYEQTNGELHNFTRTTANASQQIYIQACDDAFMKTRSGLVSRTQAIREAIDKAAEEGLYVTYPSGHRDTVEVAVRRAVTTGTNQAALRLTADECERQGTNFVIVSSHLGARVSDKNPIANHAGWQGKVYRLKERKKGFWGALDAFKDRVKKQNYPLLKDATGWPDDPLGLGGYNCRHSMYPYIPGITQNHMQQFDEEENKEAYENSQKQRAMERAMRKTKRVIEGENAAAGATTDPQLAKELRQSARDHQKEFEAQKKAYDKFCKDKGLNPNMERTYTASVGAPLRAESAHTLGRRSPRALSQLPTIETQTDFSRVKTGCDDITEEVLSKARPNTAEIKDVTAFVKDGVRYDVGGTDVNLSYSQREKEVGEIIQLQTGMTIQMMPVVSGRLKNIRTPDYLADGKTLDLKTLTGTSKDLVYNAIHKKGTQAEMFILDISGCPLREDVIEQQVIRVFESPYTRFVNQIFLLKDDNIVKVYRRKR